MRSDFNSFTILYMYLALHYLHMLIIQNVSPVTFAL